MKYAKKILKKSFSTKSKEFKALQRAWYAKLAKDGFKDIEWTENPESRHLSGRIKRNGDVAFENRAEYYLIAERYLQNYYKLRHKDRFIWKLHTKGKTYEEISKQYLQAYGESVSVYTVYYWVQDLAKQALAWDKKRGGK